MAWNEPGNNKDQDPWNRKPNNSNQGPPDLDEALGEILSKLRQFFGANKSSTNNGDGDTPSSKNKGGSIPTGKFIGIIIVGIAIIWGAMGFYTVDQQERAVVLRLGKYIETVQPGLQWNPPLIDIVSKVNVTAVRDHNHSAHMLTEDENIVSVSLAVQYIVADPKNFQLKVNDPINSLSQATESSLRHVVGGSKMDSVLTEGRQTLGNKVQIRLQSYLDKYQTGLLVSQVNIEDTSAPSQVQAAFNDVIKAREDEQRVINEAQTYANGVIPESRGQAIRIIEEANAYQAEVIAKSTGEAERFTKLVTEYEKAPEVTRERLYIVAMEDVLSNNTKILVDVEGGNNMMVLPLEQLLSRSAGASPNLNYSSSNPSTDDINAITNRVIQEINRRSGHTSTREGR